MRLGIAATGAVTKSGRQFWARISFDGERFNLGYHVTPEDAARAYDIMARELYGPLAWVNFRDSFV